MKIKVNKETVVLIRECVSCEAGYKRRRKRGRKTIAKQGRYLETHLKEEKLCVCVCVNSEIKKGVRKLECHILKSMQ